VQELRIVDFGLRIATAGCCLFNPQSEIRNPQSAVDPPGVAPGFPACGAGVFLLDDEPGFHCGFRIAD
jgi:hypothetical protein